MKHVLIVGHPDPHSLTRSVAQAYEEAARGLGDEIVVRDLYGVGFDPRLTADEIPRPAGFAPAPEIAAERALVAGGDIFAFCYPLWFNAPPAIVVGYVQRVFGMGFGYGPVHGGGNEPLLKGKGMISFSSSGAPAAWLQSEGGWAALRNLFDAHVANVCGLSVIDHVHFGAISSVTRPDVIARNLQTVKEAVKKAHAALSGGA